MGCALHLGPYCRVLLFLMGLGVAAVEGGRGYVHWQWRCILVNMRWMSFNSSWFKHMDAGFQNASSLREGLGLTRSWYKAVLSTDSHKAMVCRSAHCFCVGVMGWG